MMLSPIYFFGILVAALVAHSADAPDSLGADSFTIEVVEIDGERAAFLSGTVNDQMHEAVLLNILSSDPIEVIYIDSLGGSVLHALAIGAFIRQSEIPIVVGRLSQDGGLNRVIPADCFSSCIYVLAGGLSRNVVAGSRVGVHQLSYAGESEQASQQIQNSIAQILPFLRQMGVDEGIVTLALEVPSDQIRLITYDEMRNLGLIETFGFDPFGEERVQRPTSEMQCSDPRWSPQDINYENYDLRVRTAQNANRYWREVCRIWFDSSQSEEVWILVHDAIETDPTGLFGPVSDMALETLRIQIRLAEQRASDPAQ